MYIYVSVLYIVLLDMPKFALDRLKRMFDYNIIGGKYNRATLLLETVQELCKEYKLEIKDYWTSALILGITDTYYKYILTC